MTVDDLPAPGPGCICCRNNGVLPATPVPGAVDKDTVLGCCEDCVAALFFGAVHPHPLNPLLLATTVVTL